MELMSSLATVLVSLTVSLRAVVLFSLIRLVVFAPVLLTKVSLFVLLTKVSLGIFVVATKLYASFGAILRVSVRLSVSSGRARTLANSCGIRVSKRGLVSSFEERGPVPPP